MVKKLDYKVQNFVDLVRRFMNDRKEFRGHNLKSLREEMRYMNQEDLICAVEVLTLKELRFLQGAGIPGHANTIAQFVIQQRQSDLKEFEQTKGSERVDSTEILKKYHLKVKNHG